MKQIIAIIRPECLNAVSKSLKEVGFNKMTVSRVLGRGAQGGIQYMSRGTSFQVELLEKIQIMMIAFDKNVDKIVDAILKNARTGKGIGEGKIFIMPCERSIKIGTAEEMKDDS